MIRSFALAAMTLPTVIALACGPAQAAVGSGLYCGAGLSATICDYQVEDNAIRLNTTDPNATGANSDRKNDHLTRDVQALLLKAQDAMAAQKWPDAVGLVRQARAVAAGNYDTLKVNQFLTNIYMNLQDVDDAETAAEAAAEVPDIPPDDRKEVYTNAIILALQVKRNDKAMQYAKALQALKVSDEDSLKLIGQALTAGGDDTAAAELAQKQIDAMIAVGGKPDRAALQTVFNVQVAAKNNEGAEKTLELLITYYNAPAYWQPMFSIAFTTPGLRDSDAIWLGRLLFVTGAPASKQIVDRIGVAAARLSLYGDLANAAAKGAGGFPYDAAKVANDKNTMPQRAATIAKLDGPAAAALAEALYGYGMYPEAESAARLALGKADPAEAAMVLGIALTAEGKYPDAIAAFRQVNGGGPVTPLVARLWVLFAQSKSVPAGGASASAMP